MAEEHVETVVVGSGFGGSVTAYRLAAAGREVCVLERGKAYPPGSFARRPREMAANFWEPRKGLQGLFDVWSFRGIEALVAAGLGGGSLIYANVLLRKDERWFVEDLPGGGTEPWPISREDLDPHYDVVEQMLGAQRFPFTEPGYGIPKTRALQEAAAATGNEWGLPPLAVTFANPGQRPQMAVPIPEGDYPNVHGPQSAGIVRTTCRLCGECDVGCNYGSKNTLDHTYLSAAAHHGAELRTRCEVRAIEPRPGGGYTVRYVEHRSENEGRRTDTAKLPRRTITCDRLVLAAGTLGSPYLLLRNRAAFPHLSPALGHRFCGNGDLLGMLLRCRTGAGRGAAARAIDASLGPVITSYVRVPDTADGGTGRGAYIEDAGYPVAVDWMVETGQLPGLARRMATFAWRRIWHRLSGRPRSDLGGEMAALLGRTELSANSLCLLGMGRDIPDGVMRLRRGYLDIDWTIATSRSYFEGVRDTMRELGGPLGARYRDNPLWFLRRVITVHPLGGCPMGADRDRGVVDAHGAVYGYPGLHVADGSVMPGPVGPNPALTIAAFANRMADRILGET